MTFSFGVINLTLAVCLFSSITANAQDVCVDLSVKKEDSLVANEDVWISLISKGDTLLGVRNEGRFCFKTKSFADQPIDILIKLHGTELLYRSLYPAFLKLSDKETKWFLKIDKIPFDKKAYPRIKEWKGIEVIEILEISSKNGEDAIILYKRKKDGTYVD